MLEGASHDFEQRLHRAGLSDLQERKDANLTLLSSSEAYLCPTMRDSKDIIGLEAVPRPELTS